MQGSESGEPIPLHGVHASCRLHSGGFKPRDPLQTGPRPDSHQQVRHLPASVLMCPVSLVHECA